MKTPSALERLEDLLLRHGVFVATFLLFAARDIGPIYIHNEMDILPYARHFFDTEWLKNDWYLGTETSYRYAFNWLVGPLFNVFSMPAVALGGRLVICALFAWLTSRFARHLRLPATLVIPFAAIFAIRQSLAAGEWMTTGLEAKAIAYFFAMAALYAALRRRYAVSSASLGLSLSFHVLVGANAIFCLFAAILVDAERLKRDYRRVARSAWLIAPFGIFGLYAIAQFLFPGAPLDKALADKAARIYVEFRNPHHTLPSHFHHAAPWIFSAALVVAVLARAIAPRRQARLMCDFAVISFIPVTIGYAIQMTGKIELLRFYWFRFADAAVPFLSVFMVPLLILYVARRFDRRPRRVVLAAASVLSVYLGVRAALKCFSEAALRWPKPFDVTKLIDSPEKDALNWIRLNTPPDSVVFHSGRTYHCYTLAQRAQFVSFKSAPAKDSEVLEWYRRLTICNNDRPLKQDGFQARHELPRGFREMTDARIRQVAEEYGLDYYVGRRPQIAGAPLVYDNGEFRVFALRPRR